MKQISIFTEDGKLVYAGTAENLYGVSHKISFRKDLVSKHGNGKILYERSVYFGLDEPLRKVFNSWSVINAKGTYIHAGEKDLPPALKAINLVI